jgi:hypothetical protein
MDDNHFPSLASIVLACLFRHTAIPFPFLLLPPLFKSKPKQLIHLRSCILLSISQIYLFPSLSCIHPIPFICSFYHRSSPLSTDARRQFDHSSVSYWHPKRIWQFPYSSDSSSCFGCSSNSRRQFRFPPILYRKHKLVSNFPHMLATANESLGFLHMLATASDSLGFPSSLSTVEDNFGPIAP